MHFQRGERGSACGAEGLRYLWRQLNSQEHMILTGCASKRRHMGGRAIRRDRAQADVPRSRPLISPCSLLYFIGEANPSHCSLRAPGVGFCRSRVLSQFAVDVDIYDEYFETRKSVNTFNRIIDPKNGTNT